MNRKLAVLAVLMMSCPLIASAEDLRAQNMGDGMRARMTEIKDEAQFHKMVDDSSEVYRAIVKGEHGDVPESILKNTRCIAILPSVLTGAIVVGGTHGEGLASCRNDTRTWSQPAAISLNRGSFGLQAGAKSAALVLFFQTEKAATALKRGEFTLGADFSAVAGKFDSGVDTSNAGVVVYSRTEGVYAGASVSGGKIAKSEDRLESYYGTKVDFASLLEGKESPDSSGYTKELTKLFPA